MNTQRTVVVAAICVMAYLPVALGTPEATPVEVGGPRYGQKLVAAYDVPAGTLQKWANFKSSRSKESGSAIEKVLFADSEAWIGPEIRIATDKNPYTVALRLSGRAITDGNVVTMWQAGWRFDDNSTRNAILPGLSKVDAKAGKAITLVAAAGPTRFKEEQIVGAVVALVEAKNWQFESARVEVWSGIASNSWTDILLSFRWALIGVGLVALRWWVRR